MTSNRLVPPLISAILFVLAGYGATIILGQSLAPTPSAVAQALFRLFLDGNLVKELSITIARALGGLICANLLGVVIGLSAGTSKILRRISTPLVTAIQSCPTIVWVSLALVWAGTGSAVPVATVFAATLPPLFVGVVQGVIALDRRALAMSALYKVPWHIRIRRLLLPGVLPFWLAAFSHTLAAGWKVAALAEFFGSGEGVGARIFWAYRRLEMADLLAWTWAITLLGIALEYVLAAPLHKAGGRLGKKSTYHEDSHAAP